MQELEYSNLDYQNKNFWVFVGARYKKDGYLSNINLE